jgi:hypothetical protein
MMVFLQHEVNNEYAITNVTVIKNIRKSTDNTIVTDLDFVNIAEYWYGTALLPYIRKL